MDQTLLPSGSDRPARPGGFLRWRRRHALPPGSACYNCATVLQGPWCHACGQLGEDYHRSAHHLIWEALEGFFHADGRLWHTLPRLIARPAALTRDFLAGKRASQVPPLRIFFIVVLALFLVGEALSGIGHITIGNVDPHGASALQGLNLRFNTPYDQAITNWARTHLGRALQHPEAFVAAMGAWAHDFAFMTLPIFGLLLAAIFMFRPGFVLFDHMIFAMHSLSFAGLLLLTVLLADHFFGDAALLLLLLLPVHQYVHMRGVYGTGAAGTALRLGVLALTSATAFGIVLVGLVLLGLAALKA